MSFGGPAGLDAQTRLAGLLVEGIKPVGARALRAPVGGDAAGDDQVRVEERRSGAAVGKGQPPELFHQRMLPEHAAILGERRQDALRALHVDVARFGIYRRAGRGIAQVNSIAQVIVVEVLPEPLAGLGVEASHSFLQIRAPGPRIP